MTAKENRGELGPNPNWVRPNLENEKGEIDRAARYFFGDAAGEHERQILIDALSDAPLTELQDAEWAELQNTDSHDGVRPGHLEDVIAHIESSNESLENDVKRAVSPIVEGFEQGKDMEAPAIIKNKKGEMHLVSGNTRLMVARALQARPKVIIGNINSIL